MSVTSPVCCSFTAVNTKLPSFSRALVPYYACRKRMASDRHVPSSAVRGCWLYNSTHNTGYENWVREIRKHAIQWKYGLFYFLAQTYACVRPIFATQPKGVPQTRLPWRTRFIQEPQFLLCDGMHMEHQAGEFAVHCFCVGTSQAFNSNYSWGLRCHNYWQWSVNGRDAFLENTTLSGHELNWSAISRND
jgi:hypothetical protein